MEFVEKPKRIEAMLATADNAAELAAWCGGFVTPDGKAMMEVSPGVYMQVPVGKYLVRESENAYRTEDQVDFEAAWQPVEETA